MKLAQDFRTNWVSSLSTGGCEENDRLRRHSHSHTYGSSTQVFDFGTRLHRSALKTCHRQLLLTRRLSRVRFSNKKIMKHRHESDGASLLVDVRRIELLSKNSFISASPSAVAYLHSLAKPSSDRLLCLVVPTS